MAVKLFEIGYLLKLSGITQVMAGLDALDAKLKVLNDAPKRFGHIGEFGKSLMKAGTIAMGAGAAVGVGLAAMIRPAMAYQGVWAHVATAMNDGTATMSNLADAQQKTMALSQRGIVSAENLGQAYYIARSNMMDHATALKEVAAAMQLVTGTTTDAASANEQMVETTRLLSTMDKLFTGGAMAHADQLAKLQTRYAEIDIGEVVNSLKYINPLAATSGLATSQMEAIAATISLGGMHGEEAGTASREVLMALLNQKKLQPFVTKTASGGFDAIASIGKLMDSLKGLDQVRTAMALKQDGFNMRDITGIGILINRYADLKATNLDLLNSNGAAAQAMATRLNAPDEQLSKLLNNIHDLGVTLGNTLIPKLNELVPKITAFVQSMDRFAERHPTIIKGILGVAAGLSALSIGVGALAFLGGGLLVTIAKISEANRLWTETEWTLNAAMDANPIGIAIVAIAALAAGAYALYKNWSWLSSHAKEWFGAGVNLVKSLAEGMLSAVMYPVHAIEHIAARIGRFIVGHSPIPEGPLHSLNLSKHIALSLQPSPVLAAIGRLAAVTAVAMPMVIGVGGGTALASPSLRAGGGAPIVNIDARMTVHLPAGANPDDFKQVLRDHQHEIGRIVERVMADKERSKF